MGTWYVLLQRWHLEVAVVLGFLLDLLLGDPEHWFHPVRLRGGAVGGRGGALPPGGGPAGRRLLERSFPLALLCRRGRRERVSFNGSAPAAFLLGGLCL